MSLGAHVNPSLIGLHSPSRKALRIGDSECVARASFARAKPGYTDTDQTFDG